MPMLTARTDDSDRILGPEMGADDYPIKPLVARGTAGAHQSHFTPHPGAAANLRDHRGGQADRALATGCLDTAARHLLDDSGAIVALSGAEYRLLRVFLDHPQRVLNRDQLLNLAKGRDSGTV